MPRKRRSKSDQPGQAAGLAVVLFLVLLAATRASAGEPAAVPHVLKELPIQDVAIDDPFWTPKRKVWRDVTIPDCFAKFEKDGAFTNFDKVRDGTAGDHGGPPWYDGLVYEMIRGSADFLASDPDPVLEHRLDGYIQRIADAAAKDPDGYINTWTQLKEPTHRWGMNGGNDLQQHDLYNAGALVDAGIHYYRATGKTTLLAVAVRMANYMDAVMGPAPKANVIPGHALAEEAMVNLYVLFHDQPSLKAKMPVPVEEQRYLKLAQFWIDNRGHHDGRKDFGAYDQDDKPVLDQQAIEGHAVRASLLWSGVVAASNQTGRADYLNAASGIWENMVARRMYITGGLGSVAAYEGFGADYDLPNNGYLETCASVGAGFLHENMLLARGDGRYADEFERALYNGVLCGVSLKGDAYFYENPLESAANRRRWAWHGCPCCPPMFLKIMGSLPNYIYARDDDAVYVNQFIGSRAKLTIGGTAVAIRQTTHYPWDGKIKIAVDPATAAEFTVFVRLPAWCTAPQISLNSQPISAVENVHGYARLRRKWSARDVIDVSLPMPVELVRGDPKVRADTGRVAIRRGPLVYCVEAIDNDGHIRDLVVPPDTKLVPEFKPDLLGGVAVITGDVQTLSPSPGGSPEGDLKTIPLAAIPYYANCNRAPSAMAVWLAASKDKAQPYTLAGRATATASHCNPTDTLASLGDAADPAASDDQTIPRFTWWDHRGTDEWVQYDFPKPEKVSKIGVYWWDERRINASCRVPQSWELQYLDGTEWKPVKTTDTYGTEMDRYNQVAFDAVETRSIRINAKLQPGWSAGILRWRVE